MALIGAGLEPAHAAREPVPAGVLQAISPTNDRSADLFGRSAVFHCRSMASPGLTHWAAPHFTFQEQAADLPDRSALRFSMKTLDVEISPPVLCPAMRAWRSPPGATSILCAGMTAGFGVRELAPAFSTADGSAVGSSPRRVPASKSGDESPQPEKAIRIAAVASLPQAGHFQYLLPKFSARANAMVHC